MRELLTALLSPSLCRGCGAPGSRWCRTCAAVRVDPHWVQIGIPVLTGLPFEGPVRRVVIDWKDNASRGAQEQMRAWMESLLLPWVTQHPGCIVVPVPSSPGSDRRRGESPLTRLLRDIAPGVVCTDALLASRPRRDQADLDRAQRRTNVFDSMTWCGGNVEAVMVVDDVLTTGATLRESARAIGLSAGSPIVGCALAHTEHDGPVANRWAGLGWDQDDDKGGFRGHQQRHTASQRGREGSTPRSR